jgi:hypothetical protein
MFFDQDDVNKEVTRIFTEIPITMLCSVMDKWDQLLMQCIELGSDDV